MANDISELQSILIQGQRLSMQGTLDRRLPAKKSVPFLLKARTGLRNYVVDNPLDPLGWRLLSQAEECLLNYPEAITCLQRSMELSPTSNNKDLKRLAILKEINSDWINLKLSPEQIRELGRYLHTRLKAQDCDHSLRFTQEWLKNNVAKETSQIVAAIRNKGGFCDCEVLANVVAD